MSVERIGDRFPTVEIFEAASTIKSTVVKTASVFGSVMSQASAFTGQAPDNDVVKYSALTAKIGVTLMTCGLMATIGPAAILAKPVLQQVVSRVVIISGNTISRFVMEEPEERSTTPFTVSVIGSSLSEALWYTIKSLVLPFELGVIAEFTCLEKTAIKVVVCTPVKQIGRLAAQFGYNIITQSECSPWKHMSFCKLLEEAACKMNGELFKGFGCEELEIDGVALIVFQISGAILGSYAATKAINQIKNVTLYVFPIWK